MKIAKFAAAAVAAASFATSGASAVTLYDNGPANFTIGSWNLVGPPGVSNSFVLGSSATITGFTFDSWTSAGESVSAISWAITTSPYGRQLAFGSARPGFTLVAAGIGGGGFDGGHNEVAIAGVALTAGSYFLELGNASASGKNHYVGWDINNGPSAAYIPKGNLADTCGTGSCSNTFTITGNVPEPASWALMVAGFGLVGGALRRRVTTVAA